MFLVYFKGPLLRPFLQGGRVTQPEGLKHSPTFHVKLLSKVHPWDRASFDGFCRVPFSRLLAEKKHFTNNGEQAACCDVIRFALVVNINCLYIVLL